MGIYTLSFPPDERHDIPTIAVRLDDGRNRFFVAVEDGPPQDEARVIAIAIIYRFNDDRLLLLDYLAVHGDFRGSGIGAAFLQQVMSALGLSPGGPVLLAEIEDPEMVPGDPDRARRLDFYRRLDFVTIDGVPYMLPPLAGGDPVPMVLAVHPAPRPGLLSRDRLARAIKELYIEKYSRPEDDPFLDRILASIPRRISYT